jgi:uncharacterized damage-inducible protein DinB
MAPARPPRAHVPEGPSALDVLLHLIDEAFNRVSWHGPTLLGAVRGVGVDQAAWRPEPGRHNIHELVVHAEYWKYAVRRRLAGDKRGSFRRPGSNWFEVDPRAWKDDVRQLVDEHRRLRETVAALTPHDLDRQVKGKQTVAYLVRGIAAHDLYHAGQIQLLKRLSRRESLSFVDAGRDPRAAALPVLRRPRGRQGGPVPSRQRS